MPSKFASLMLSAAEIKLLTRAIISALIAHEEEKVTGQKHKTEGNYRPKQRGSSVNDAVFNAANSDTIPHMRAWIAKSGGHEYIVIHLEDRNINILLVHLGTNDTLPTYSKYREEFSANNIRRINSMSIELQDDSPQLKMNFGDLPQTELNLFTETPTAHPFCIILTYDGRKGRDTFIRQGALYPDQKNWIFNQDITPTTEQNTEQPIAPPVVKLIPDSSPREDNKKTSVGVQLKPSALSPQKEKGHGIE